MNIFKKTPVTTAKGQGTGVRRAQVQKRLKDAAVCPLDTLLSTLETSSTGLTDDAVEASHDKYGNNTVTQGKKYPCGNGLGFHLSIPLPLCCWCWQLSLPLQIFSLQTLAKQTPQP